MSGNQDKTEVPGFLKLLGVPELLGDEFKVSTWLDAGALKRVAGALGSQDVGAAVNACMVSDVKRTLEFLALVVAIEKLSPGTVATLIDILRPVVMKKAIQAYLVQKVEEDFGAGAELKAVYEAAESPRGAGKNEALIRANQKIYGYSEEEAADLLADRLGVDVESLKRSLRRGKSRQRKT